MDSYVLVIGGATLDTIISYEDMETLIHERKGSAQSYLLLEEGKKIEVLAQETSSGGGATNAAVSFKRQGYEVILFCKLGRDVAGERVLSELKTQGLSTENILFDEDIGTATSFVVPSLKGDRTVFAYRGANAHLLTADLPLSQMQHCSFAYITSLSQASALHLPQIVRSAQKNKVKVAVNPGISQLKKGAPSLKTCLSGIDTLILNEEEAKTFMVSLLQDEASSDQDEAGQLGKLDQKTGRFSFGYFNLREFFKKVLSLGPNMVVVTNGSEGVYVATHKQLYFHAVPPHLKVVNTLGAGDAFGSALVGMWYQSQNLEQSIRAGIVNSASVIQYPDAKQGLLSQADLLQALQRLSPELLRPMPW